MKALEILSDAMDQFAKDPIGFLFKSMLIAVLLYVLGVILWNHTLPAL